MSETSNKTRLEHDCIGQMEVPANVYWGIHTQRAIGNFPVSGITDSQHPELIRAYATVKRACAIANEELGLIDPAKAEAIRAACLEIEAGKLADQFPVDVMQGGAGTSSNMNMNEVIANRALELMGHQRGEYQYCSPNDHVNRSQSTNDAYPTAIHIGLYYTHLKLVKHFEVLIESFRKKATEFAHVIKMGRTQLEDAVPMTLGQTFNGFASILRHEVKNLDFAAQDFLTVNMGATAIGTGITAEPEYAEKCIAALRKITGLDIKLADDLVGATSDTSCMVGYSAAMRRVAVKMNKICNDLRLLASGPRCGLGEFNLPAMQPGSSIMPGKVNPVIPEVVNQICYRIIGNDLTVTFAAEAGQLQLNVMEPVMVHAIFSSIKMLQKGMDRLRILCVEGITANTQHCREMVLNSIGIVTALNPTLGYENSSRIAKRALKENRSVYDLVLEEGLLTKDELDQLLKPESMIKPHKFYKKK